MNSESLLQVSGVSLTFTSRRFKGKLARSQTRALDNVSLDVRRGEIVGLVGESGSGKTSLARSIVRLAQPESGTITFEGSDILSMKRDELRLLRRRVHLIYQDPYQSLNPRMTVGEAIAEPVRVYKLLPQGTTMREHVTGLLESVGLSDRVSGLYPRQLSGGQRQRVAIARAFALSPHMIIADEVVSALDVSVQSQILNLLQELCSRSQVPMLFISHQLAVVAHLTDRVAVMYRGRIVEVGPTISVFGDPKHPYTRRLLAAHPLISDSPESHASVAAPLPLSASRESDKGCQYRRSCPLAMPRCEQLVPELEPVVSGHSVACFAVDEASGSQTSSSNQNSR